MEKSSGPEKIFVLDTNVLLHDPRSIFAFGGNEVVIPFVVIEEIDNQKKRQDDIGRNARHVSQLLDKMRSCGKLSEGIDLENGGKLRIELNHQDVISFPVGLDPSKPDNRILAVAYNLGKKDDSRPVILVTKDLNLRLKADVVGIEAQDFYTDKVDYQQLYTGVGGLEVSQGDLDIFYKDGKLELGNGIQAYPNQLFVLRNGCNSSQSALTRFQKGFLHRLTRQETVCWGIKGINKEQRLAMELLCDDEIKVVTLVGNAGTGKTLLALAVGLEKVVEQGIYTRLLITRPVTPMGDDIGFLPGSKGEKLRPWMQPIYDNCELLIDRNSTQTSDSEKHKGPKLSGKTFKPHNPERLFRECEKPEPSYHLDYLIDKGLVEIEALTYVRGRSIPRQFILCDEAQNLSPHMIKTLITRVGEGTKIVFTGDPEQIDHPYLDASSNGLTYIVEKLKGEEIAGHVTLVKGERSKVAEMGARLL